MKRTLLILMASLFWVVSAFAGTAQDKKEEKQKQAEAVAEALAAQRYVIEVDWAIPTGGRNVNLTPGYSLEVRHDTLVTYLPFYGRAYSLPYGQGGGIELDTQLKEYVRKEVVKRRTTHTDISFEATDDGDNFTFRVMVFPDGQAQVTVLSNHRASISYRGYLSPIEEEKK